MDIKRYDFDTRRECRQKRKDIGRSKFEQTLLKTWGLEAQKDDSQLESTFWVSEFSSGEHIHHDTHRQTGLQAIKKSIRPC